MKRRTVVALGATTVAITVICLTSVIISDKETITMAEPPDEAMAVVVDDSSRNTETATNVATTKSTTTKTTTKSSNATAETKVSSAESHSEDDKLPEQVIPKNVTPVPKDLSAGVSTSASVTTTVIPQEHVPETVVTTTERPEEEEASETVTTTTPAETTTTTTTTPTTTTTTTPSTTTRLEVQSELTMIQEDWDPPEDEETESNEKKFSEEEVETFIERLNSEGYDIPWDKDQKTSSGVVLFGGYPLALTDSSYEIGDFVDTAEYGVAIVVDNTAIELTLVVADW